MATCLSTKKAHELASVWTKRSPREQYLIKRGYTIGPAAIYRFLNWLEAHDVYLMTEFDMIKYDVLEIQLKKIRAWKRGEDEARG